MTTTKLKLTSTFVASVKPAAKDKRDEYRDTEVAQFALRVTDRGVKSYIVAKRWPGSKMTIKRTVGDASCTGAVESTAANVDDVIMEVAASRITERGATRADDKFAEAAMEDRKKEGYF